MTATDELTSAALRATTEPGAGIGHANLRRAVHARVFGSSDPVRIGRYTMLERIGSGAMAVVYAAYDNELDRKIAVKVLRMDRAIPRERLLREAKALARVSHPNVVHVYEVGEHEGEVFMAMELVPGTMLGEWLGQAPRSWQRVVAVFVEAARGLAAAHAQGVVHRDFKPDNVLVGEDGRVRVVDFGLAIDEPDLSGAEPGAIALGSVPLLPGLTQTGATLGTPGYMAPEQMEGAPADPRADQFSLCVALYEALAGERPFDGPTLLDIRRHIAGPTPSWPTSARSLPVALKQAICRGLSEDPEQRYASMDALVDALSHATRTKRWRAWGVGGLGALTAAAALAGGLSWRGAQTVEPADDAPLTAAAHADTPSLEPQDALVLEQARNLLALDPTAAVERLTSLSDGAEAWSGAAWILAAEAESRGLAHRSLQLPEGSVARASIGTRVLVSDAERCELRVQDPDGGLWWRHAADCDEHIGFDGRQPAITREGHHVVFSDRGIVTIADLERRVVRSLGVQRVQYDKLALARSGAVVLAQGDQLMVWGPDAAAPETLTSPATDDVLQLKISANGRTIATALRGNMIEVRHLPTGVVRTLPSAVFEIALADDGEQLVARHPDGPLVRWRLGHDAIEVLDDRLRDCIPSALSADGRHLIAIDLGKGMLAWDLPEHRREGWVDAGDPGAAALSPDDRRAAVLDDGVVRIATIHGQVLRALQQRERIRHFEWISDDELMTIARSGELRYWTVPAATELRHEHRGEVEEIAFVPGRSMLLSAGVDRSVRRWDLKTGRSTVLGTTGDVPLSVEASPDGRHALASLHGGQVLAWDLETDALMVGPSSAGAFGSEHEVFFAGPDGVSAWDLRTGSQTTVIPTEGDCRFVDAVPTGWVAAECEHDEDARQLRVWARDQPRPVFVAPAHFLTLAMLGPAGQRMIWANYGEASLFEVVSLTGEESIPLESRDLAYALALDPTGDRLIGRDGSELRQWRTDTGDSRVLPRMHDSSVTAAAYSPEGTRFAHATSEGRIFVSEDPVPTQGDALRAWVRDAVPQRVTLDDSTP